MSPRLNRPAPLWPRSANAWSLGVLVVLAAAKVTGIGLQPTVDPSQLPTAALGDTTPTELPIHPIAGLGSAAEFYFSPDSRSLVGNARQPGDSGYHVYVVGVDGTGLRRINDVGADACSFFLPDGRHLIWTSTRDHLELPPGNYSDPATYPQGAELYLSDLEGGQRRRLTSNAWYDAEVSVSPDGERIIFARQIDGRIDLWQMRVDGSDARQITHTDSWQEGGAQFLPDGHTILFRAWRREDQGQRSPLPMEIFTIRDDGTGLRSITSNSGTNWSPFPAADGRHFVYVKVLPPKNYEIFLGDLEHPGVEQRITWSDGFDGFPALSPDGRWLVFASIRPGQTGERSLRTYLMDISSLGLAAQPQGGKPKGGS